MNALEMYYGVGICFASLHTVRANH